MEFQADHHYRGRIRSDRRIDCYRPQVQPPLGRLRSVATQAIGGENRPDVTLKPERLGRLTSAAPGRGSAK
jgi:hypothetical protein